MFSNKFFFVFDKFEKKISWIYVVSPTPPLCESGVHVCDSHQDRRGESVLIGLLHGCYLVLVGGCCRYGQKPI